LQKFWREGDSLWVKVATPTAILRYIVPKGYIAVDGTSLTVCDVQLAGSAAAVDAGCASAGADGSAEGGEGFFTFMLIAYTQQHIIIPRKAVGDRVNLEADVMGKYAERALAGSGIGSQLTTIIAAMETRLTAALQGIEGRLGRLEGKVEALEGKQ
jgi:riboflavin synthase